MAKIVTCYFLARTSYSFSSVVKHYNKPWQCENIFIFLKWGAKNQPSLEKDVWHFTTLPKKRTAITILHKLCIVTIFIVYCSIRTIVLDRTVLCIHKNKVSISWVIKVRKKTGLFKKKPVRIFICFQWRTSWHWLLFSKLFLGLKKCTIFTLLSWGVAF